MENGECLELWRSSFISLFLVCCLLFFLWMSLLLLLLLCFSFFLSRLLIVLNGMVDVGGDLFSHLSNRGKMPEQKARPLLMQVSISPSICLSIFRSTYFYSISLCTSQSTSISSVHHFSICVVWFSSWALDGSSISLSLSLFLLLSFLYWSDFYTSLHRHLHHFSARAPLVFLQGRAFSSSRPEAQEERD